MNEKMPLVEALAHLSQVVLKTESGKWYRNFKDKTIEVMDTRNKFPRWNKITRIEIADLNQKIINTGELL